MANCDDEEEEGVGGGELQLMGLTTRLLLLVGWMVVKVIILWSLVRLGHLRGHNKRTPASRDL